jgi:hypothetical protein
MDALFALPVEVRRCRRNQRRLVVVSATGEVLLRTLSDGLRDQDIAERFALAMNEWAADVRKLERYRYGLSAIRLEAPAGAISPG